MLVDVSHGTNAVLGGHEFPRSQPYWYEMIEMRSCDGHLGTSIGLNPPGWFPLTEHGTGL